MNNIKKLYVTPGKIAEWLGIAERTVRELANRGILHKAGEGRYDPDRSIPNYIDFLKDKMSVNDQEYKELQKKKLRIQVDELEGRLISVEEVETFHANLVTSTRAKLLSLPKRLSPELTEAEDQDEMEEIIKKAVYEILEDLSGEENE